METRVCKKCSMEYPLTREYFYWANKEKGLLQTTCILCQKQYAKDLIAKINAEGGERLEKRRESRRRYVAKDPAKEAERQRAKERARYWANKEEKLAKKHEWYLANREYACQKAKEYNSRKDKDEAREIRRKYKEEHREEIRAWTNQYRRERYAEDPLFRFTIRVRNMLNRAFDKSGNNKRLANVDIIGLSSAQFRDYLLKTFEETYGYPWDFQEPVHIDHIIPLASATTEDDVVKLSHYTNLRLIKASDNMMKGSNPNVAR